MAYNFNSALGLSKTGRKSGVAVTFQNGALVTAIMGEIEDGLKKEAARELRDASQDIARQVLIPQLKRSARSSPMKIARAFAETAVARRDRIVLVQIGGSAPALSGFKRGVGKKKIQAKQAAGLGGRTASGRDATSANYAASMAWGSEYGPWPWTDVNNYGQRRREPEGYWVTKAVASAMPEATRRYSKAIEAMLVRYGKYR